ncbi:MAG: ThiF family adenylyltransferase [Myxococcota bacterium]
MLEAQSRLLLNPSLGPERLARLQRARVAIVGAGTLGGHVVPHLSMLGIGLTVVDPGAVEAVNLGAQMLPVASVGALKAEVRADQARAFNRDCQVRVEPSRVEELGVASLADCDLVVGGLDSRLSRLYVNRVLAQQLGKPWIDAALDGSGEFLLGSVSVFDPTKPEAACYGCRFDESALERIRLEEGTSGCPSWRADDVPITPPTLSISPLAAIVAGHQTLMALRVLLGEDLGGTQLLITADGTPRVRSTRLERNPSCPFHVERLAPLRMFQGETVAELLKAASRELRGEPEGLLFHRQLALGLRCDRCSEARRMPRAVQSYGDSDVTCRCGGDLVPTATERHLHGNDLKELLPRSFSDLGLPRADVVSATRGNDAAHFIVNP